MIAVLILTLIPHNSQMVEMFFTSLKGSYLTEGNELDNDFDFSDETLYFRRYTLFPKEHMEHLVSYETLINPRQKIKYFFVSS
jgi:hypothetical protein